MKKPRIKNQEVVPKIKELHLRNFRSFGNARLDFDDTTIILGRNGSGKSTLLHALNFLRNAVVDNLDNAIEKANGPEAIKPKSWPKRKACPVSFALKARVKDADWFYGFTVQIEPNGECYFLDERFFSGEKAIISGFPYVGPGMDEKALLDEKKNLPLALKAMWATDSSWRRMFQVIEKIGTYQIVPGRMRAIKPLSDRRLVSSGKNIAQILGRIRNEDDKSWNWILGYMQRLLPSIQTIEIQKMEDGANSFSVEQFAGRKSQSIPVQLLSEGALRFLGLLVAMRQKPAPSLLFIDEVENSLDQSQWPLIVAAMQECSRDYPIAFTTHNPGLLNAPGIKASQIRTVVWEKGESRIFRVREETRDLAEDPNYSLDVLFRHNGLFPSDNPDTSSDNLLK